MNESKQLRSYIRVFTVPKKIAALVLFLACAFFFWMAFQAKEKKDPDPKPMDTMLSENGSYVYVDAVGVSDWVYEVKSTTYYMVVDADYDCYVAKISAADLKKLSAPRAWFDSEDDDAPMPEPVRLTGVCKGISSTVRSSFSEVLELSEEDFDAYFGEKGIWVGETPSGNVFALWLVPAIISLAGAVVLLLIGLAKGKATKRAIARLEQRSMLPQAEADLSSPTVRSERKDQFRMSGRFLFGKGIGLAAAWDDVLWCYQSVTRYNFIVTYRILVICTADGIRHEAYYRKKDQDEIVGLMDYIGQQNPNVMLGYSLDNNRAYREAVKKNK